MAAITTTTANFTVPAIGSTVAVSVGDTSWMQTSEMLAIESAGYYEITTIGGATSVTVRNLGYSGNAAALTVIASGSDVNPGNPVGSQLLNGGSTGYGGASPTTTKGDILADNGASNPRPSLVRLAVGANGKSLVADSTQATGLSYAQITPNTVANDNNIPRFDGTSGTPMPLQDSKMLISDEGAIQSTPSGGNARGLNAIDLQVNRSAATQVASGAGAVLGGGMENTASGDNSTVAGGSLNTASNTGASVTGGQGNTASGIYTCCAGGQGNTASNDDAVVAGGAFNEASGIDSAVLGGGGNVANALDSCVVAGGNNSATGESSFIGGGNNNMATGLSSSVVGGGNNTASAANSSITGGQYAVADKYGQRAFASGQFAAQGDAQVSELIFRNITTDATPTILYLDGGTSPERATISSGSSWTIRGAMAGRRDNGDSAGWEFTGVIHNNAGVTGLVAAITPSLIAADAGCAATWGQAARLAVTADIANDCLQLEVTGTAGNNIRWVATIRIVEVSY